MANLSMIVGSVYGAAEEVAERIKRALSQRHVESEVTSEPLVENFKEARVALIVCSTTGEGDLPHNIESFFEQLEQSEPNLEKLRFAVVALGDSRFKNTFCMAGRKFEGLLHRFKAQSVTEMLELDAKLSEQARQRQIDVWLDSFYLEVQ